MKKPTPAEIIAAARAVERVRELDKALREIKVISGDTFLRLGNALAGATPGNMLTYHGKPTNEELAHMYLDALTAHYAEKRAQLVKEYEQAVDFDG
jgi:hypothetical protein